MGERDARENTELVSDIRSTAERTAPLPSSSSVARITGAESRTTRQRGGARVLNHGSEARVGIARDVPTIGLASPERLQRGHNPDARLAAADRDFAQNVGLGADRVCPRETCRDVSGTKLRRWRQPRQKPFGLSVYGTEVGQRHGSARRSAPPKWATVPTTLPSVCPIDAHWKIAVFELFVRQGDLTIAGRLVTSVGSRVRIVTDLHRSVTRARVGVHRERTRLLVGARFSAQLGDRSHAIWKTGPGRRL